MQLFLCSSRVSYQQSMMGRVLMLSTPSVGSVDKAEQ
jgi:hypothetical protein